MHLINITLQYICECYLSKADQYDSEKCDEHRVLQGTTGRLERPSKVLFRKICKDGTPCSDHCPRHGCEDYKEKGIPEVEVQAVTFLPDVLPLTSVLSCGGWELGLDDCPSCPADERHVLIFI